MKIETINQITIGLSCLFIGVILGSFLQSEPSGIGGFVYREIEWQEQTINIMDENCNGGLFINDWEIEGKRFLYCYNKICENDWCKEDNWQSPVLSEVRKR